MAIEQLEPRAVLATLTGQAAPDTDALDPDFTQVKPSGDAAQSFTFGFKHINEPGAETYLVDSTGMRKYSEWQSPPITYWGPSANNAEGRLVYKFPFTAPSQTIRLLASSPCWDFFTEPGGTGRGASALEVSRNGSTWISLRNNLEPRQWGGDWAYDENLPATVVGGSELWVRMRFYVESAPNSSYTDAQFARSTSTATNNVFSLSATLITNSSPTDVALSATSVAENAVANAVVGTLSTSDPDFGDTFTYSLVAGVGSTDNASFQVVGNELRAAAVFDFETKSSYSIRLRSTDQGGLSYEKAFVVSVTNANDLPTLASAASPKLVTVAATVTTPSNGSTHGSTLVSSLIDAGGALANYADPDADQPGIAIIGLNLQGGRLWFTTTNGTTWREITQASDAAATLLHADTQTRLFYSPAQGFQGTIADVMTIRAWDRTGGFPNGATSINTQPLLGPVGGSLVANSWAAAVAVSSDGRYAFVIDQGLAIIDVSVPSAPVRVGEYKSNDEYKSVELSADGRYAYVTTGYTGLQILDVTSPSRPVKVGSYNTNGVATKVVVSADGRYAYVADGNAGLRILDVSNPAAPKNLGGFQTAGYVDSISLSADNNYLFCAVNSAGMQVIDVSNPSTPSIAGRCDTAYSAYRIALSRDQRHAFVTEGASGVTLLDIRNPKAPRQVATLDTPGSAEAVAISPDGRHAFVADANAGLRIVAIAPDPSGFSNANDAVAVTVGGLNAPPTSILLSTTTLVEGTPISARLADLSTIDPDFGDTFTYSLVPGAGSTDNSSFQVVGTELRAAAIFDFESKNSYSLRLRSTDQGGLSHEKTFVISVTNANDSPTLAPGASPKLVTVAATVATPATGSTQGSTLVASLIETGGALNNYSDPDSDQAGIAITGLNLQGGRLWFTTTNGATWREITQASVTAATLLHADNQTRLFYSPALGFRGTIADVVTFRAWDRSGGYTNGSTSVNTQPLLGPAVGSLATGGGADMVAVSPDGRYAFVIDQGLVIIDVSIPTAPVRVGSYQALGDYRGIALSADGRYAYVATGHTGLQILDITKPASPIKVGAYNTAGFATKVVLSPDARYAYIADGNAGLRILDVSNPAAPQNVGGIGINDWARGVAVTSDGRYAFVADWTAGLKIVDISNPAQPVGIKGFQTAGYVDGVALSADNRYLFCAVASAGMQVINVSNPSTPVSVGLCNTAQAGLQFTLSSDGTRAFVADGDSGLTLVDTRNPSLPLLLTTYDTPGSVNGVALAPDGRHAFVGDGAAGLRVIAVGANPSCFSQGSDTIAVVTNAAPSDISLSPLTIPENSPVGTVVGTLFSADADPGDAFTYTFASGTGSTDNTSFAIAANTIKTAFALNYEAKSSYSIRVRSTDAGGLFTEKAFTITVANVNEAPTDIVISASSVLENEPAGTLVGNLSTTDPDVESTFSYAFVTGTGSTDNAAFTIVGNVLTTATSFNYESKSSYSVRLRSTDVGGLFVEKAFVISVTDVDEAPTDISLSLASIAENRSAGVTVGTLSTVDPHNPGSTFTYSLVAGTGSTDNAAFTISGNTIKSATSFDFESKTSHSIRVRSTNAAGLFTEKVFSIRVVDVVEDWSIVIPDGTERVDDRVRDGSSRLVKSGTGTLVLDRANSHTGGVVVNAGRVIVRNVQALGTGRLWIKPGAAVVLDVDYGVVPTSALTLETGGSIDFGYGQLSIDPLGYVIADVQAWLREGNQAGFKIDTAGIQTRFASRSRTIGYYVSWDGRITVGYAAMGDTDLSGEVDMLDIINIVGGGKFDALEAAIWSDGDFNHDGLVDVLDVVHLVSTDLFNQGSYRIAANIPLASSAESTTAPPSGLTAVDSAFIAFAIESSSDSASGKKPRIVVA